MKHYYTYSRCPDCGSRRYVDDDDRIIWTCDCFDPEEDEEGEDIEEKEVEEALMKAGY